MKPTFAVAVRFQIKPEFADQFRDRVLQQASDSLRLESGCHQFDVLVDPSRPNLIVLYETYTDAGAFEKHLQTEHFLAFDNCVSHWIAVKEVERLSLLEIPHA